MQRPVQLRAAAFQFDVTNDVQRNSAAVEAGLREAAERGVELVVLPELWASGFPDGQTEPDELRAREEEAVARLARLSAELGLCVAGSAFAFEDGRVYNRLELFENGARRLSYDKVHLFTPTAEQEVCAAGELPPATVEVAGVRVSGAICYDLRFPELFRVPFRELAQVLVISAQWPRPRDPHWRALVVARAIENQCFVVACNRTGTASIGRRQMELEFPGNSIVVSPYGEVLAEGRGEVGLVQADLELGQVHSYRTRVPVQKDDRPELYRSW